MQSNVDPSKRARSGRADVVVIPDAAAVRPVDRGGAVRGDRSRRADTQYRTLSLWALLTDAVAIVAALSIATAIRFGAQIPSEVPVPKWDIVFVIAIAPPLWLAIFAGYGLYSFQRLEPVEEFRRLIAAVSVGVMLVVAMSFWSKTSYSRIWVGSAWLLSILLLLLSRRAWHQWMGAVRHAGALTFRTLVVGTNEEARRLADVMRSEPLGFAPVGFIATDGDVHGAGRSVEPVVGTLASLGEAIQRTGAECVFVASSAIHWSDMPVLTRTVRREAIEVRVTANLPEMLSSRLAPQSFRGLMALALKPVQLTGAQAALKRLLDVAVAAVSLVVLSPILLAIAALVKVTSRGPVIYRQQRLGRGGRPFSFLKFRTMVRGADGQLAELDDRNEASAPLFKIRDDPRVTRVGRFLRRWSLDELPQLWNVLKGDMSLVGPRPPLAGEVREYEEWHYDRLEVRPGITGVWQVSGRSDLSFDDYVRLDLFYLENWSPILDLYTLLRTIPAVARRTGAY